ncbi:MAG TPA: ROK family protein [Opitutaceae bacterium]|nr:ROK family protein [Opitutaceae bacterium]
MRALGIDIGGSGIKGAPVDTETGELLAERLRIETPEPSTPAAVLEATRQLVAHFKWKGPVGIGFPGVVKQGWIGEVGNLDNAWVGAHGAAMFRKATRCPVAIINDADAASLAEVRFGAGRGVKGAVLLLTLGTGIGSAFITNGVLYPNAELGAFPWRGRIVEKFLSGAARKRRGWNLAEWGAALSPFLVMLERIINPDLIIIGGGVSKKGRKLLQHLKCGTRVVAAKLSNDAGIVGAAMAAEALKQGK